MKGLSENCKLLFIKKITAYFIQLFSRLKAAKMFQKNQCSSSLTIIVLFYMDGTATATKLLGLYGNMCDNPKP